MKIATFFALATTLIGTGMIALPSAAAPDPSSLAAASGPSSSSDLDAAVASVEENLQTVQVRVKDGILPASALQDAKIALANAQVQAALAHSDTAVVSASLKQIEDARQELLAFEQQQYRVGVEGQAGVLAAKEALMRSQLRTVLYQIITIEQQKLDDTNRLVQVGAASQEELEKAQADLMKAQDAFSAAQP